MKKNYESPKMQDVMLETSRIMESSCWYTGEWTESTTCAQHGGTFENAEDKVCSNGHE